MGRGYQIVEFNHKSNIRYRVFYPNFDDAWIAMRDEKNSVENEMEIMADGRDFGSYIGRKECECYFYDESGNKEMYVTMNIVRNRRSLRELLHIGRYKRRKYVGKISNNSDKK